MILNLLLGGAPMILEHTIMPSIGTTSSESNMMSSNSMIPAAAVTTIPMVIQPQQVVLSMPTGALIAAPVAPTDNTGMPGQLETSRNDASHHLSQQKPSRSNNPP